MLNSPYGQICAYGWRVSLYPCVRRCQSAMIAGVVSTPISRSWIELTAWHWVKYVPIWLFTPANAK